MAKATPHRKHPCSHPGCERAFLKAEHLARHERSHSGSKPFSCPVCSRRFSRIDSMIRHSRLHGDALDSADPVSTTGTVPAAPPYSQFVTREHTILGDDSGSSPPGLSASTDQAGQGSQSTEQPKPTTDPLPTDTHTTQSALMPIGQESEDLSGMALLDDIATLDVDFDWALSSEDFFNMLRSDSNMMPLTLPMAQYSPDIHSSVNYESVSGPQAGLVNHTGLVDVSRKAVRSMSKMIKELPSKLVAELEAGDIGSSFFDDCLDLFFTQFCPIFPVLHKPTFSTRECGSTLLLNVLALGSSFVGSSDALSRGESLWSLAHAVVATSWQSLMSQRGPRDECDGVQLVLTAALGQTYAFLSQNHKLRMTSQIFHGLGFYWSRHCGIYEAGNSSYHLPALDEDLNSKTEAWRKWAANETRLRGILGHYILDGQIAGFTGNATCVRHAANPLPLPASTAAFNATSPDAWILEMQSQAINITFREFITALFHVDHTIITQQISDFSIRVVLECLQSLILEQSEARGTSIGTPSKSEVVSAALQLYHWQICRSADVAEMALRWHSVLLSMTYDMVSFSRQLSSHCEIQQVIFPPQHCAVGMDHCPVRGWTGNIDARRALLHAFAIRDIIQGLPFDRSHAIHIPSTILAAAVVHAAHLMNSIQSVSMPEVIDWDVVWDHDDDNGALNTTNQINVSRQETAAFLRGDFTPRNPRAGSRKMSSELHALRMQLKAMATQWGVSQEIEKLLEQWHNLLRRE